MDYLKDLQDRAARLSSDWKTAENRANAAGVVVSGNELLELRGRTADLKSEIEAEEGQRADETKAAYLYRRNAEMLAGMSPAEHSEYERSIPVVPSPEQMEQERRGASNPHRA
jgi:TPR repeat protein